MTAPRGRGESAISPELAELAISTFLDSLNPPRAGRGKSARSLALIEAATVILNEIQPASVRAVCYRLFTLGLITCMSKAETNRVSTQLTWARERGVIPWEWIVDETREAEFQNAWRDGEHFLESMKRQCRRDRWGDQPTRIEVWSEKGTIRGTLAPVLHEFGVTFRVLHGYGSSTPLHEVAEETAGLKRPMTVLYCGDWDPSGLHMSNVDLPARLERYGANVDVYRVALELPDLHTLPSFPAESKRNDPRHEWYVREFGAECWELDALSPVILRDRIEDQIVKRLDLAAWERADVVEAAERESITTILSTWPGISGQASK